MKYLAPDPKLVEHDCLDGLDGILSLRVVQNLILGRILLMEEILHHLGCKKPY